MDGDGDGARKVREWVAVGSWQLALAMADREKVGSMSVRLGNTYRA